MYNSKLRYGRSRRRLTAALLAVLTSSPMLARAATDDDAVTTDDKKVTQVMRKISVSATRGPQELADIPATVTVKDAAEIEAELAADIRDLIRYEPGVSVSNASTRFGLAGFNIRGIEGNRVAIRIDNVRLNDAFAIGDYSNARRNLVDLDTLKTAEIVRGPASALYGSDALGGVVSFVTKDPRDLLAGKSGYFRVKSGYQGDSNGWNLGGTIALGNPNLAGLLTYTHREREETKNQGQNASFDRNRTAPNPQARDSDSVLTKFTWNPNDANALRLTLAYDRDRTLTDVLSAQGLGGIITGVLTVSLTGDDRQERRRIAVDHTISAPALLFEQLEWRLYVQETDIEQRSEEYRTTVRRNRLFDFEQSLLGGEVVLRKSFSLGATENLFTYGIDASKTETEQLRDGVATTLATGATTATIMPDVFPVRDFPITDTYQYAFFAQDEIAIGAVQLAPGVRVDYYRLEPQADDIFTADNPGVAIKEITETSISPKFGAVWSIGAHSIYANYAHGFRAPPYADVNIGFTNAAFRYITIANPDLKPETSNGYEVGVRGSYERGYFALAGFYTDYTDFINSLVQVGVNDGVNFNFSTVPAGSSVFQAQNYSDARIYGVELRAGIELFDSVKLRSSIAYARGDGVTNQAQQRQPLTSVNPLKGVLGIAYEPSRNWGVELVTTAVDKQSQVEGSAIGATQLIPGGYAVLDVLAHAELADRVQLNLGVFNLTDKKYTEWTDVRGVAPPTPQRNIVDRYTQPGLNASASVAVRF